MTDGGELDKLPVQAANLMNWDTGSALNTNMLETPITVRESEK